MNGDASALAAWNIGAVLSVEPASSGTIHRTLLVTSERGRYALRAYRYRERLRIEQEHATIAYAARQGVPAVAPLPLPGGATILDQDGRFYALFPHAPGRQLERLALGDAQITAMGRALARLHRAMAGCPPQLVQQRLFDVNRPKALAHMSRLETLIGNRPVLDQDDRRVLARLASQRAYAERADPAAPDLRGLAAQVIHGDFQQTNLFFEQDEVVAIIDWDQAYVAPRAWEIARTLDLVFGFEPGPARSFLAAYRADLPMPIAELDQAAVAYSYMRVHDVWMYEAVYCHNNERVRVFIADPPFVAPLDRWRALRPALDG